MKPFYIFIIFIGFSHAKSDIEFPSTDDLCRNDSDFCSCDRIWVTCDCQSGNKTTANLFHSKRFIKIHNCQQLTVSRESFKYGTMRVIFQNIKNLSLAAGSFDIESMAAGSFDIESKVHINLTISNSNLSEIPSGMFSVSDPGARDPATPTLVIKVTDSDIGRIAPGVFGKYLLRELTIINTTIGHIDAGAIDNQVQQTSFINNTFVSLGRGAVALHSFHRKTELVLDGNRFKGNVPQFLEGNITDVYIYNNSFPELRTSPWQLKVQGVIILYGNTFAFLPRHGMNITVHERISLVENSFQHLGPEAFLLIKPTGKKTIFFMDGNLIYQQEPLSLCLNEAFSSHSVVIKHVKFQQKCHCNISNTLSQALDIKNLTLEAIYKNDVHEQWFKNGQCQLKPQGISHISIDQFLFHSCFQRDDHIIEILLAFALILAAIAGCVILGWRRMRTTPSVSSSAAGYQSYTEPCPPSTVPASWLVVQPESRTYKETEIHVVFDKAQEIADDDTDTSKDERDNDQIKNIKRTPSPSTRQSCPVLPTTTNES